MPEKSTDEKYRLAKQMVSCFDRYLSNLPSAPSCTAAHLFHHRSTHNVPRLRLASAVANDCICSLCVICSSASEFRLGHVCAAEGEKVGARTKANGNVEDRKRIWDRALLPAKFCAALSSVCHTAARFLCSVRLLASFGTGNRTAAADCIFESQLHQFTDRRLLESHAGSSKGTLVQACTIQRIPATVAPLDRSRFRLPTPALITTYFPL